MKDYFTNLVDRHLGTCDTIQPRNPGRYEQDSGGVEPVSPERVNSPDLSDSEQYVQSRTKFSADLSEAINQKSDIPENSSEISSRPELEHSDSIDKPATAGQQTVHSNSTTTPRIPELTQPSDANMYPSHEVSENEPPDQAAMENKHSRISGQYLKESFTGLDAIARDTVPRPAVRVDEYRLEGELNQRINAVLQRLGRDPLTSDAKSDSGSSSNGESLVSHPSTITSELLNTDVKTEIAESAGEQQASQRNLASTDDKYKTQPGNQEIPSWLNEMEVRLGQHVQDKNSSPEPVINVTIGRVEVRAVQAQTPEQAKDKKKPVGVMSLDAYLKQRDVGKHK